MFVCSRCDGLTVGQFCHCYILPMVNWGDGETAGLRQFDDWCAAALAAALDVTVFVHDIEAVQRNDPHNAGHADRPVVRLLRRGCHYVVVYT